MLIVLAFNLFFIVLFYTLNRHYKLWRKAIEAPNSGEATPIKHKQEFALRCVLMLPCILLFTIHHSPFTMWRVITATSMISYLYWFLFDGLFNLKRGKDWWFIGTVDKDESFFDNIKRKLGPGWTKIVQISLAAASVLLYFFS